MCSTGATIVALVRLLLLGACTSTATQWHWQHNSHLPLPSLPQDHLARFLYSFPHLRKQCEVPGQFDCQPKSGTCWGFEPDCTKKARFQTPECLGEHTGWAHSKEAQINAFYYQADFGYIQQQISELTVMCAPTFYDDSSLECTKYLRFCRGRNLLFDFRDLTKRKELIRYHLDVLRPGQLLGHCELNKTRLVAEMEHMSALQSWAPELRNIGVLPQQLIKSKVCDITVNRPMFIMKIDAAYNMYHHFCDFFNLYASLFVNQSHPLAFDTDVQILIWETYPYDSPFREVLKVFTRHDIWTLSDVKGKRVCLRNVVLPLLPRMIFGLYYNTPIVLGCEKSGLFRAFAEFMLHRLEVPKLKPLKDQIRITFLLRRTKYRQVLNEEELLDEISANRSYSVRRVSFEREDFIKQLDVIRNTDLLIGMHGAGLTHLMFLPNWGAMFELYNCEDPNCYKDLARLRGVNYITWEHDHLLYPQDAGHHPEGGAHAKFTNYAFDRKEFARLVGKAAGMIREDPEFQNEQSSFDLGRDSRDEL